MSLFSDIHHPNLVAYYDMIVDGEDTYIVTEFVDTVEITEIIRPEQTLLEKEQTASVVVRQIVSALAFLHNEGFIHQSVKMSNVLVSVDGVVKLSDAYCSAMVRGEALGNALYMWTAPGVSFDAPAYFCDEPWLQRLLF